jgi:hypothetical protein
MLYEFAYLRIAGYYFHYPPCRLAVYGASRLIEAIDSEEPFRFFIPRLSGCAAAG